MMRPRRVLLLLLLTTPFVLACGPTVAPEATTSPSAPTTRTLASPAASAANTTYEDPVLDITFIGPPGLIVTRAQPGLDGRTTQAAFSTHVNPTPPRSIDLTNELVITAEIALMGTNRDHESLS
jgi:hypothetical protein